VACNDKEHLLHAYFDGELDLVSSLAMEEHLKSCAECALDLRSQQTIRGALRSSGLYQTAPQQLADTIRAGVASGAAAAPIAMPIAKQRPWAQWIGVAAAMALIVFAAEVMLNNRRASQNSEALVAQEVVESHVRSLQLNHLMDVPSTDQHTVKPWFDGKLDFAPPVNDFAPQGFPLTGGRLDFVDHHNAAALLYMRRKHILNVFIWPDEAKTERRSETKTIDGYNIVHWDTGGFHYWIISDVSATDERQLAELMGG
jgi:anti-sigma factor RsiW